MFTTSTAAACLTVLALVAGPAPALSADCCPKNDNTPDDWACVNSNGQNNCCPPNTMLSTGGTCSCSGSPTCPVAPVLPGRACTEDAGCSGVNAKCKGGFCCASQGKPDACLECKGENSGTCKTCADGYCLKSFQCYSEDSDECQDSSGGQPAPDFGPGGPTGGQPTGGTGGQPTGGTGGQPNRPTCRVNACGDACTNPSCCHMCAAIPQTCPTLVEALGPDGCFTACASVLKTEYVDELLLGMNCTAAEKAAAATAIQDSENAEVDGSGDRLTWSVGLLATLAVAAWAH